MGPTALAGEDALIGSVSPFGRPTQVAISARHLGELGVPFAEIQRPIKREAIGYSWTRAAIKRTQRAKFAPVAPSRERGAAQTSSRANSASA